MKYDTLFERLVANTAEPESPTACWVWTGRRHGKGYGRLNVRRDGRHVTLFAHREMQRQVTGGDFIEVELVPEDPLGPIRLVPRPARGYDDTDDHLCWNTACCHPDHVEDVSRSENAARRWAR